MECPHAYHPKLDKGEEFWKKVQTACIHAFSSTHWHAGKSHWYLPTCKTHIFQAVLRRALAAGESDTDLAEIMKRGPEAESATLYAFSIDPALKYRLTSGERDFLRKLNLEEFITSNSWGVLHTQLVTEAITSLEPDTFSTMVKGEKVRIIARKWRKQFQEIFHLAKKEPHPVDRTWQLKELFPSPKETTEAAETVKISECQLSDAKRPLRLLSSLFCLNPTHHNYITMGFVEMVVAALNGQEADWPQEFYHEITEELTTLHSKHSATRVKVEKTSIGPHLTLILRAGGLLNIREELEAGYRSEKALTLEEQLPNSKKTKTKEAREVPEMQPTIRVTPPREKEVATDPIPQTTTPVYSVTIQPAATSSDIPGKGVILETSEPRTPPNPLPAMVEQICQAHRRLENLLISFTVKAPQKLVSQVNSEFFKIQSTAILREGTEGPPDNASEVLLKSQGIQLKHLTQQLENSDSLNDVNIETIFHLEEELSIVQNKLEQAEETVLGLQGQKGEALNQVSQLKKEIDNQAQQLRNKDEEIEDLSNHITDINGVMSRQDALDIRRKDEIARLEAQAVADKEEIACLRTEFHKLGADISAEQARTHLHPSQSNPDQVRTSAHPIMNKEKHTLAAGIANRLLNELRRELAHTQEEKADLLKKIVADYKEFTPGSLPQTAKWTGTEFHLQILQHLPPLNSIMQYHRVCGGLHLLLSNIPPLRAGCSFDFPHMEALWKQADAAAKDTLAFMWCLNELKVPAGAMETLSGSPPFYVKRYILRCITLLGQHHNMVPAPPEPFPTLRSYSHSQYHAVRNFQRGKLACFDQALATLATTDTSICYEAVQHYQTLINKQPAAIWQPTLSYLKTFVTKTLEEQHTTLTSRRFGTINSSTLSLKPKDHNTEPNMPTECIGTCFL